MAAINVYVTSSDDNQPEGLCPKCFNPSLKLYIFERIDMDGITLIGERIACRDEKIWVAPLKEYATS